MVQDAAEHQLFDNPKYRPSADPAVDAPREPRFLLIAGGFAR
jgi:hypothetical protein